MDKFKIVPKEQEGKWYLDVYGPVKMDAKGQITPPQPIYYPQSVNFNTKEETIAYATDVLLKSGIPAEKIIVS